MSTILGIGVGVPFVTEKTMKDSFIPEPPKSESVFADGFWRMDGVWRMSDKWKMGVETPTAKEKSYWNF